MRNWRLKYPLAPWIGSALVLLAGVVASFPKVTTTDVVLIILAGLGMIAFSVEKDK